MTKTVTRFEASDVDLENNEVHKFLSRVVGGIVLYTTIASMKAQGETIDEQATRILKTSVAMALNIASETGFTISKREDIPDVFQNALD